MMESEKNWGRQANGLFLNNHMPLLDRFVHDLALVMDVLRPKALLMQESIQPTWAPVPSPR